MKILERGAEAVIIQKSNHLVKHRIPKSYRLPELDEKLRKLRTRNEAKLLEKSIQFINVPRVISSDEKTKSLSLEKIQGKRLSRFLEKLDYKKIAKQIGQALSKLHEANIIHGDLTTSNMMHKVNLYLIDFGLGFHSERKEDKAVDLHVLKEALEAKHPTIAKQVWQEIIKNYRNKDSKQVIARLQKVESRGRYKAQY